jgi:hypothetical protein
VTTRQPQACGRRCRLGRLPPPLILPARSLCPKAMLLALSGRPSWLHHTRRSSQARRQVLLHSQQALRPRTWFCLTAGRVRPSGMSICCSRRVLSPSCTCVWPHNLHASGAVNLGLTRICLRFAGRRGLVQPLPWHCAAERVAWPLLAWTEPLGVRLHPFPGPATRAPRLSRRGNVDIVAARLHGCFRRTWGPIMCSRHAWSCSRDSGYPFWRKRGCVHSGSVSHACIRYVCDLCGWRPGSPA